MHLSQYIFLRFSSLLPFAISVTGNSKAEQLTFLFKVYFRRVLLFNSCIWSTKLCALPEWCNSHSRLVNCNIPYWKPIHLPEGIILTLEIWHLPSGERMTDKNKSLFCLLARLVQSMKCTSGNFIVSLIISSVANETMRTNFLSSAKLISLRRFIISVTIFSSAFSWTTFCLPFGLPRGFDIALKPKSGSS